MRDGHGPRLEEAVLAALEAVAARGPTLVPRCPVCGGTMRSKQAEAGRRSLSCTDCGSVLSDAAPAREALDQLRLVS
jgi:tRNA(Ile2) C34 agmatinyltransferase TiaS